MSVRRKEGEEKAAAGGDVLSQEEVVRRLEIYDVGKSPRLSALFPPGQYPHTRRCAVLLPFFFSPSSSSSASPPQLHVLLTQRAASLRFHADTVAFPGGVQDPGDKDDIHTALREAHEEIGLDPQSVTVVARLPPMFVGKNNSVFPIVAFIPNDFQPKPNPHEVAKVFSVPLKNFVEKNRVIYARHTVLGTTFQTPFFNHVVDGESFNVWGATCMLCIAVARIVLGPWKRFRILRQVGGGHGDGKSSGEWSDWGAVDEEEDESDDNVFGDLEIMYHMMCKANRPTGQL